MQNTVARLRRRQSILKDREGGFTLIELLIVIVIMGILAAVVVFAVQNLTKQSAQASCHSDYKTIETAAEAFKAQTGAYPTTIGALSPTYVKEVPSTTHYSFDIDSSGAIMVGGPSGTPAPAVGDLCDSVAK
jgi:prepilin-type N-terminal cleavage/methylation domain-containing protein